MKNRLLIIVCLFFYHLSIAQPEADPKVVAEIDQQLWKVFQSSYETYDAESFNNLHTDDILRITEWGIRKGYDYKENNVKRFSQPNLPRRRIDFCFEKRIHNEDTGYEVGMYKVVRQQADGSSEIHVGRFHIVLKKVNGQWKIAQDWDEGTINGVELTEEDFEKMKRESKFDF